MLFAVCQVKRKHQVKLRHQTGSTKVIWNIDSACSTKGNMKRRQTKKVEINQRKMCVKDKSRNGLSSISLQYLI